MTLELALTIHCVVVTTLLALAALALRRKRLLTLLNGGTWVLFALGLYFVINPALALATGSLSIYQEAVFLYTREGVSRILWMLVVLAAGIVAFFVAYTRRPRRQAETLEMPPRKRLRWSIPAMLAVGGFLAVAIFSILYYRTAGEFIELAAPRAQFDRGRIVGGSTGYTVAGYKFYMFPALLLLFSLQSIPRTIGLTLVLAFVGFRLFDASDRASVVSMVAAAAMVTVAKSHWKLPRAKARPNPRLLGRLKRVVPFVMAFAVAVLLIVRGHTSISDEEWSQYGDARELVIESNTAMLPVLYARSYLVEHQGYDYGAPLLTRALFGWLPRQYFPWKDDLTGLLLHGRDTRTTPADDRWISGPKSSAIGSLYDHGGLAGVVLGMFLLGYAIRALDRIVTHGRTDLARTLGVVWMAQLWIMLGSSTAWIMSAMFTSGLPFVALALIARLQKRGMIARTDTRSAGAIATRPESGLASS